MSLDARSLSETIRERNVANFGNIPLPNFFSPRSSKHSVPKGTALLDISQSCLRALTGSIRAARAAG